MKRIADEAIDLKARIAGQVSGIKACRYNCGCASTRNSFGAKAKRICKSSRSATTRDIAFQRAHIVHAEAPAVGDAELAEDAGDENLVGFRIELIDETLDDFESGRWALDDD